MTNKHKQVGNPDDFDGGTYGLVSNECFATSVVFLKFADKIAQHYRVSRQQFWSR
jgi:hypothetical protein